MKLMHAIAGIYLCVGLLPFPEQLSSNNRYQLGVLHLFELRMEFLQWEEKVQLANGRFVYIHFLLFILDI